MDIKQLERVLVKIANKLNEHKILWVLGGSMLLYYKGITTNVNDLDIMIKEDDEKIVKDILHQFGLKTSYKSSKSFDTPVFLEYIVDQVDVDIIGGFTIRDKGKSHYYPLKEDDYESITIQEACIYLDDIKKWLLYYKLMHKDQRVKQITSYLEKR